MKKSMWMSAIGLALAIAVSAPASAQGGGGRGQGRGQQATLATIPVDLLAGPLKLTDEQKTKIKAAQEKVTKAMAEARAAAQNGGGGGGGAFQAIRETQQAANAEITGVLTEEQKGKVEGVVKEFSAYQQLGLPLQVVGELKLTDDQKSKIKPIAEEMQKKIAEMRAGGGQPDRQAMQQMRQDYSAKVQAILTDDQKKAIEKWRMANPMRRPGGNPPN